MATDITLRVIGSTGGNGQASSGSEVPSAVLLGRTVSAVDETKFADYLAGATVAVTGAAGSVGSELCMRLARLGAAKLVLVDQAEAPLIDLLTMLDHDGFAHAVPVLADVKSRPRAVAVFEQHRPEIVFHAAAYKQVPLLEANPVEAVATNVFGTHSVVEAARHAGVNCFVLFSTDKAVEPTSILGQTKAIAEWIVAAAGRDVSHARYGAVRLGNVADSAGSMLPLFRRRVATGEPVPVTHPSATRYMMTVGEAAGLAVVAGALVDSESIFWLDVGPSVRVLDVVRRLAEAAARDVEIELVGLRPGERLHERLVGQDGEIEATPCDAVFRSPLRAVDHGWLDGWIAALAERVDHASAHDVRSMLGEMYAERERGTAAVGTAVFG
jgi:FlaA1/EpsC-like NDP-sugar epimerase